MITLPKHTVEITADTDAGTAREQFAVRWTSIVLGIAVGITAIWIGLLAWWIVTVIARAFV